MPNASVFDRKPTGAVLAGIAPIYDQTEMKLRAGAICIFNGVVAVVKSVNTLHGVQDMLMIFGEYSGEVGLLKVTSNKQSIRVCCLKRIDNSI